MNGILCLVGSGLRPPAGSRVVELDGELPIGRGEPAFSRDGWWSADETVSRRHAVIARGRGGWTIADLAGRNGTVVDGALLKQGTTRLRDGAVVVVGGQAAVFRLATREQLRAVGAEAEAPFGPVATTSPALAFTLRRLRILAPTDRPVLLAGETGTGKEVYARAVHARSERSGPFVAVNCAGFPRELLESELFGYKRGSHSQATEDQCGLVSAAEGGTLFLDEIGEMPPQVQAKLLRFLQDRSFFGLGWRRARTADVRIIAATQDPHESLRPDVLARFGPEPIVLPPLRGRVEDVGVLAHHFLAAVSPSRAAGGFDRGAFLALCHHAWIGNVRRLEAVVADAALLAAARGATRVGLEDLPADLRAGAAGGAATNPEDAARPRRRSPRPAPTRDELLRLLQKTGGDVPALARELDRQREQVWRWCKSFDLDPHDFVQPGER